MSSQCSNRSPLRSTSLNNQQTRKQVQCKKCFKKFKLQQDLDRHQLMKYGIAQNKENVENQNSSSTNSNPDVVSRADFDELKLKLDKAEKTRNKFLSEKNSAVNKLQKIEGELIQLQNENDALCERNRALMRQASMPTRATESIDSVTCDQIELLGSKLLYERLDKKLGELKLDTYFTKEQFRLYAWRKDYFYSNYGHPSDNHWYTEGADDAHYLDTVPYQITQRFDEIVSMASMMDYESPLYLDNDELVSSDANFCFNGTEKELPWIIGQLWDQSDLPLDEYEITFSDAAHMIVDMYAMGPKRLEHLAMKTVLVNILPLDHLPKVLQLKAEKGMFSEHDPIPNGLTPEGRFRYEVLKTYFEIEHDNFKYDLEQRKNPKYDEMFPKQKEKESEDLF